VGRKLEVIIFGTSAIQRTTVCTTIRRFPLRQSPPIPFQPFIWVRGKVC